MIFIALLAGVILAEWKIKSHMERSMKEGVVREVAGDAILLRKCHNPGAAGGAFKKHPEAVKWGTAGVILCLAADFARSLRKGGHVLTRTGYALTLGGGISNLMDRFRQGFVTDYFSFNVKCKRLSRLIFNLADMCVLVGGILVALGKTLSGREKKG